MRHYTISINVLHLDSVIPVNFSAAHEAVARCGNTTASSNRLLSGNTLGVRKRYSNDEDEFWDVLSLVNGNIPATRPSRPSIEDVDGWIGTTLTKEIVESVLIFLSEPSQNPRQQDPVAAQAVEVLAGFVNHQTISRDRTASSDFVREQLIALVKAEEQFRLINAENLSSKQPTRQDHQSFPRNSQAGLGPTESIGKSNKPLSIEHPRQAALWHKPVSAVEIQQEHKQPGPILDQNIEMDIRKRTQASRPSDSGLYAQRQSRRNDSTETVDVLSRDSLLSRIAELEQENADLRAFKERDATSSTGSRPSSPPVLLTSRIVTFYYIEDRISLEEPVWTEVNGKQFLRPLSTITSANTYLERNSHIQIAIHKEYAEEVPPIEEIMTEDGSFKNPIAELESMTLVDENMKSAVSEVISHIPDSEKMLPNFNVEVDISAPYLFLYCALPFLPEILPKLTLAERALVTRLKDHILQEKGGLYDFAEQKFKSGLTNIKLMIFLIRPGDVLVSWQGSQLLSFIALDWVSITKSDEEADSGSLPTFYFSAVERTSVESTRKKHVLKQKFKHTFRLKAWTWTFDGTFEKSKCWLMFDTDLLGSEEEEFRIQDLGIYPLQYADESVRKTLDQRGKTFWKCRGQYFVSYRDAAGKSLNNIQERYMVDIEAYRTIHLSKRVQQSEYAGAKSEETELKTLPEGNELLVFPPTIQGFNLRKKTWDDLQVDRISEVSWNKKAFENLVVDPDTKELVEALVTNQLTSDKSTDIISGKGNGLIILLHGGPGTGKTFTAEGVAEMAEKPLYRVTCGDVGTRAEDVEKYLESVLYLGKIWDCVVLLDEADIFLEERSLNDLERNALVSVFLRVLEYYEGILILTSNRVGTFDEAFKSRIQLALHYENLNITQRRKIWRNFISRLHDLEGGTEGGSGIDFDDLRDHIDELAKEDMNGRQIRNAITTARQLAKYKKRDFCYAHLKHTIAVGAKFEKYLTDLRGYSDDLIMRDSNVR